MRLVLITQFNIAQNFKSEYTPFSGCDPGKALVKTNNLAGSERERERERERRHLSSKDTRVAHCVQIAQSTLRDHDLTLADIAREIGVSAGLPWSHFQKRDRRVFSELSS